MGFRSFYKAAKDKFNEIIDSLIGLGPQDHSKTERYIEESGKELLRECLEGQFAQQSYIEKLEHKLERKNREEGLEVRSRKRQLETTIGRVSISRLSYKKKGEEAKFPLDEKLNLPEDMYSIPLRQRVCNEGINGSWAHTIEQVDKYSGAHIGKRQAQELAIKGAQDYERYYEKMGQWSAANDNALSKRAINVASIDSTGVTVIEESLRDSTRKAAENEKKRSEKGDPMAPAKLRKHNKRMAVVSANWQQERDPRKAEDIIKKLTRKPNESNQKKQNDSKDKKASKKRDKKVKERGSKPQRKQVRATIENDLKQAVETTFDEIQKRDPQGQSETVILVDGQENQLQAIKQEAEKRSMPITIVLDIMHVIHILFLACTALAKKDPKRTVQQLVTHHLESLLNGSACRVAAAMRTSATKLKLTDQERIPVDVCCNYLVKNSPHLQYKLFLRSGLPISTSVIEGSCRHLVKDRMDITGARWSVKGAEAILKLRSLQCSGDFNAYWNFHEQQQNLRNYHVAA